MESWILLWVAGPIVLEEMEFDRIESGRAEMESESVGRNGLNEEVGVGRNNVSSILEARFDGERFDEDGDDLYSSILVEGIEG